MRRLPDPAWKSGPPDPPAWTVHEHEFWEPDDVEVLDGYVYVYYQCSVTDGHPHGHGQRCGAKKTVTYCATTVEQGHYDSASGEWIGAPVDPRGPHSDVYRTVLRKAEAEIEEDPFMYDVEEESDFEVEVKTLGAKFFVLFEHEDTEVHEW